MVKLVFVFDHFGPYHVARVGAAAGLPGCVVTGVELHPRSRTYGWEPREVELGFRKVSLPRVELRGRAERRALRPHLERVLGECGPDVVFVNGWGDGWGEVVVGGMGEGAGRGAVRCGVVRGGVASAVSGGAWLAEGAGGAGV
jgi:hypothetical protein